MTQVFALLLLKCNGWTTQHDDIKQARGQLENVKIARTLRFSLLNVHRSRQWKKLKRNLCCPGLLAAGSSPLKSRRAPPAWVRAE